MAYTSGDFLCRVTLKDLDGLPADNVTMDFAMQMDDHLAPSAGDMENAAANLHTFFHTVTAGAGDAVDYYLSSAIDRTYFDVKCYPIVVGAMGSPIGGLTITGAGTLNAAGSSDQMPNEVAAVLSIHADLTDIAEEGSGGTRPAARRRGRVFLGPLCKYGVGGGTGGPTVTSGFRTTATQAADRLIDDSVTDGMHWSVWSRADVILRPVVGGFMDNAFDTQRRRGIKATTRTTF